MDAFFEAAWRKIKTRSRSKRNAAIRLTSKISCTRWRGAGRVYDWWRALKARIRGESFQRSMAADELEHHRSDCADFAAITRRVVLGEFFLSAHQTARSAVAVHAGVSVLIPARNEEANIEATLLSVLANREVQLEVVVLDDHSTDRTADIVTRLMASDVRVRFEIAPPLPAGWCGKQYACHILAQRARYPQMVFIDADVRLP